LLAPPEFRLHEFRAVRDDSVDARIEELCDHCGIVRGPRYDEETEATRFGQHRGREEGLVRCPYIPAGGLHGPGN